jgi:nitroreductase
MQPTFLFCNQKGYGKCPAGPWEHNKRNTIEAIQ